MLADENRLAAGAAKSPEKQKRRQFFGARNALQD
jgi:hypothetical protein